MRQFPIEWIRWGKYQGEHTRKEIKGSKGQKKNNWYCLLIFTVTILQPLWPWNGLLPAIVIMIVPYHLAWSRRTHLVSFIKNSSSSLRMITYTFRHSGLITSRLLSLDRSWWFQLKQVESLVVVGHWRWFYNLSPWSKWISSSSPLLVWGDNEERHQIFTKPLVFIMQPSS